MDSLQTWLMIQDSRGLFWQVLWSYPSAFPSLVSRMLAKCSLGYRDDERLPSPLLSVSTFSATPSSALVAGCRLGAELLGLAGVCSRAQRAVRFCAQPCVSCMSVSSGLPQSLTREGFRHDLPG